MLTLSLTAFREQLLTLLRNGSTVTITKRGKPIAILTPVTPTDGSKT